MRTTEGETARATSAGKRSGPLLHLASTCLAASSSGNKFRCSSTSATTRIALSGSSNAASSSWYAATFPRLRHSKWQTNRYKGSRWVLLSESDIADYIRTHDADGINRHQHQQRTMSANAANSVSSALLAPCFSFPPPRKSSKQVAALSYPQLFAGLIVDT